MSKISYQQRLKAEQRTFSDCVSVQGSLPPLYGRWAMEYLRPKLKRLGFPDRANLTKTQQVFLEPMIRMATQADSTITVASIGSGNCEHEIELLMHLREAGLHNVKMHCCDVTQEMLQRGQAMAQKKGVASKVQFLCIDTNRDELPGDYDIIMAHHSLHHIVNLEHLFDDVARHLRPHGRFLIHDMIGRNGHMLWPEALEVVESIWRFLPRQYKFNHQWRRYCDQYVNWDCSVDGFEGIRAQDILPLLLQRFGCEMFLGFSNIIDKFIGRAYGHNFDWEKPFDQALIRFVAETDEEFIRRGIFTPTHLIGWFTLDEPESTLTLDGQVPRECVHAPLNQAEAPHSPSSKPDET